MRFFLNVDCGHCGELKKNVLMSLTFSRLQRSFTIRSSCACRLLVELTAPFKLNKQQCNYYNSAR